MTAEAGHFINRVFLDQNGALNQNGGDYFNSAGVSTKAAIEALATKAASVTITPAAGTSNVCLATIQVKDSNGNAIASQETLDVWLSDAATGAGLTGTSASGAVAAGTAGTDLLVRTAKKETLSLTDATGKYILSITDTAKTGFYIAVLRGSQLSISAQLVTGNYG